MLCSHLRLQQLCPVVVVVGCTYILATVTVVEDMVEEHDYCYKLFLVLAPVLGHVVVVVVVAYIEAYSMFHLVVGVQALVH